MPMQGSDLYRKMSELLLTYPYDSSNSSVSVIHLKMKVNDNVDCLICTISVF